MKHLILLIAMGWAGVAPAQDDFEDFEETAETKPPFSSTRVINGHSTETLPKNTLEFRVEHRFGDVAGPDPANPDKILANYETFFGFDNAADIRLGFEYGVTDKLMLGLGRSKGSGAPYRALIDGLVKYKILTQEKGKMPLSLSAGGSMSFTYMKASSDLTQVTSFPNWQHRFAYSLQVNMARSFGKAVSLQLSPSMVHRNYVASTDVNTMFALGGAARFAVSKKVGIILEYYYAFRGEKVHFFERDNPNTFRNSLGIAVEFETFGHNFTVNLTNSRGFGETQFIPYTYSDWMLGQFRLGFTIGRKFAF
jgi:hypothetical protein